MDENDIENPFEEKHIDKIANDFFRMADAMLRAREAK